MVSTLNPYLSPASDVAARAPDASYQPRLFEAGGRIGRARYLLYTFALNLLWLPVAFSVTIASQRLLIFAEPSLGALAFMGLALYSGPVVIMLILARRRLHDMDVSGWFSIGLLVPFLNLVMALLLLFWPGSRSANRFGPRPAPSPSMTVMAVVIALAVPGVGILAAIAIPAYQGYAQTASAPQQGLGPDL